jgi:Phage portal protein, SPP1 Gp6-like
VAYGLPAMPLRSYAETDRFWYMDRLERYFRNEQDAHKSYDWEGNLINVAGVRLFSPITPDWAPAHSERKPNVRYGLARVIVSNLTQMSLGGSSFPEINCESDEVAEQALRKWSKLMKLPARLAEARNFGGSEGTACLSLATRAGRFRVDVHNPKHVRVEEWADREEFRPLRVIKAYSFTRDVYDRDAAKLVKRTYWYVRTWDAEFDRTWADVPDEIAQLADWADRIPPTHEIRHGYGFCPFYWCQNLPNSQEEDGEGDYEGTEEKIDEINGLYSATHRGQKKNVDPTLVIKDVDNEETVVKGSGAVIYSAGGASYLELAGTATASSLTLGSEMRQQVLEECQVVIPREDKITGAAQSAAAMRILYRPMIARCDTLRDQYGDLIVRLLEDVRRIAAQVRAKPAYDVLGADGQAKKVKDTLVPDLDPGALDNAVTLRWPEYFALTSQDVKDTTATAQAASGGKQVISHKTAVEYVGRLYGVADTDEELKAIEADSEAEASRATDALNAEADAMAKARGKGPAEDVPPGV